MSKMPPTEMAQILAKGLLSFPVTHFDRNLRFQEGPYREHCAWLLSFKRLTGLFAAAGLPAPRRNGYRLEGELESLLGRSFPLPGDADKIREIFAASLADDRLGIPTSREGERIRYAYPVAVLVADKPAR